MIQGVKGWKSFDEQLSILEDRGLILDEKPRAYEYLKRVGYYRLSGYWYPFHIFENGVKKDEFIPDTKFSDIIKLYDFDRNLRLLALEAIERIELAIQVEIAYLLGKKNPFAHETGEGLHGNFLRVDQRRGSSKHSRWRDDYNRLVHRSRHKPFVSHNIENYGGLPIWVAIEIFDFGTMSKLYAGMQHLDKINIEKQFGLVNGTEFQTWLRGFNFIRNISAHHGRLWNCNMLERSSIPNNKPQLLKLNNSKPFLYFCMMQTVLRVICPDYDWADKFLSLLRVFPHVENKAVTIHDMGYILNAETWQIWR